LNRDEKFDRLIAEARSWKMSGWDFSALKDRWIEEKPPWEIKDIIMDETSRSNSLLDLGTGGGEFLASLGPLPSLTLCTEGYAPNLKIARARLKPLRVDVIYSFCDDNNVARQRGALPFRSESLDLVIDRHESFIAGEVFRILKRGHCFITQQVGNRNLIELNALLGSQTREPVWDLAECERQVTEAGFDIVESRDAKLRSEFKDVGVIVSYLLSAPWQIPDFTIDGYLAKLAKLHEIAETDEGIQATAARFYLKALKRRV
jgi:hypothetical protein